MVAEIPRLVEVAVRADFEAALEDSGLEPSRLVLEITEGTAMAMVSREKAKTA